MCLAKRFSLSDTPAHVQSPRLSKTPTACTVALGARPAPEGGGPVRAFLTAGVSALSIAARLDRFALRVAAFSAIAAIVVINFKVSRS